MFHERYSMFFERSVIFEKKANQMLRGILEVIESEEWRIFEEKCRIWPE